MISFWATTVGEGPYKPAIQINHNLYIMRQKFDTLPQAYSVAQRIVKTIEKHAIQLVGVSQFVESKSPLANKGTYGMGRIKNCHAKHSSLYEGGKHDA